MIFQEINGPRPYQKNAIRIERALQSDKVFSLAARTREDFFAGDFGLLLLPPAREKNFLPAISACSASAGLPPPLPGANNSSTPSLTNRSFCCLRNVISSSMLLRSTNGLAACCTPRCVLRPTRPKIFFVSLFPSAPISRARSGLDFVLALLVGDRDLNRRTYPAGHSCH